MLIQVLFSTVLSFQDAYDYHIDSDLFSGCHSGKKSYMTHRKHAVSFSLKPLLFEKNPSSNTYYSIFDDYLVKPETVCFDCVTKEPIGVSQANAYLYDIRQQLLTCTVDSRALNYIIRRFLYFLDSIDVSDPSTYPVEVLKIPPVYSRLILNADAVYCCFVQYLYTPELLPVLQAFLDLALAEINALLAIAGVQCANANSSDSKICVDIKFVYLFTLREVVSFLISVAKCAQDNYETLLPQQYNLNRVVVIRFGQDPTNPGKNSYLQPEPVTPFPFQFRMMQNRIKTPKPPIVDDNSRNGGVDTDKPTVDTDKPAVDTDKPAVDTDKPAVDTDKPAVDTDKPVVDTNKPPTNDDEPLVDNEGNPLPVEDKPESEAHGGESRHIRRSRSTESGRRSRSQSQRQSKSSLRSERDSETPKNGRTSNKSDEQSQLDSFDEETREDNTQDSNLAAASIDKSNDDHKTESEEIAAHSQFFRSVAHDHSREQEASRFEEAAAFSQLYDFDVFDSTENPTHDETEPKKEKLLELNPVTEISTTAANESEVGTSASFCGGLFPYEPTDYTKILAKCNSKNQSGPTPLIPLVPAQSKIPLKKVKSFCPSICDDSPYDYHDEIDVECFVPFTIKPQKHSSYGSDCFTSSSCFKPRDHSYGYEYDGYGYEYDGYSHGYDGYGHGYKKNGLSPFTPFQQ